MNRYDFVYLFDVVDGNPNGDPDAGNLPRIDPATGQGLVTDVCLKRKVRNYVEVLSSLGDSRVTPDAHKIFIREKAVLNTLIKEGCNAAKPAGMTGREWMCRHYYDVRTFGAVMTTGENAGQVRGSVQLTFARSIDPIVSLEHSITRMAVATEAESEKQGGDNRTMGGKSTISYGLYRCHGFVTPHYAKDTHFGEEDLELLWEHCNECLT